jgi:hypothetical protein
MLPRLLRIPGFYAGYRADFVVVCLSLVEQQGFQRVQPPTQILLCFDQRDVLD